MKKADQITGVVLLAFSTYLFFSGLSLELWWGDEGPGPGFLPFLVGILLGFLSILLIFNAFKKSQGSGIIFQKEGLKLLGILIGGAVGAGLLVNVLGMVISMGLLAGFLVTVLSEERKWMTSISIMIILPVVLYLIFKVGLDVPFPEGIFGL